MSTRSPDPVAGPALVPGLHPGSRPLSNRHGPEPGTRRSQTGSGPLPAGVFNLRGFCSFRPGCAPADLPGREEIRAVSGLTAFESTAIPQPAFATPVSTAVPVCGCPPRRSAPESERAVSTEVHVPTSRKGGVLVSDCLRRRRYEHVHRDVGTVSIFIQCPHAGSPSWPSGSLSPLPGRSLLPWETGPKAGGDMPPWFKALFQCLAQGPSCSVTSCRRLHARLTLRVESRSACGQAHKSLRSAGQTTTASPRRALCPTHRSSSPSPTGAETAV